MVLTSSSVYEISAFSLFHHSRSGPEVIKLFSYSTQLSMTFILLINVIMPTLVSMIKTTSERLKARYFFIFGILVFMSSCNFVLS